MRKSFSSAIAVVALCAATFATAAPAQADPGANAVIAGVGGFALGALMGGAVARPAPPPVVYAPPPRRVYVEPGYEPVVEHCWRERRPVFDEYGDVIGHRHQRVCE